MKAATGGASIPRGRGSRGQAKIKETGAAESMCACVCVSVNERERESGAGDEGDVGFFALFMPRECMGCLGGARGGLQADSGWLLLQKQSPLSHHLRALI